MALLLLSSTPGREVLPTTVIYCVRLKKTLANQPGPDDAGFVRRNASSSSLAV